MGVALTLREAKRAQAAARNGPAEGERMLDLCFWLLVFGLLGARALYVATNVRDYLNLCKEGLAGSTSDAGRTSCPTSSRP